MPRPAVSCIACSIPVAAASISAAAIRAASRNRPAATRTPVATRIPAAIRATIAAIRATIAAIRAAVVARCATCCAACSAAVAARLAAKRAAAIRATVAIAAAAANSRPRHLLSAQTSERPLETNERAVRFLCAGKANRQNARLRFEIRPGPLRAASPRRASTADAACGRYAARGGASGRKRVRWGRRRWRCGLASR